MGQACGLKNKFEVLENIYENDARGPHVEIHSEDVTVSIGCNGVGLDSLCGGPLTEGSARNRDPTGGPSTVNKCEDKVEDCTYQKVDEDEHHPTGACDRGRQ